MYLIVSLLRLLYEEFKFYRANILEQSDKSPLLFCMFVEVRLFLIELIINRSKKTTKSHQQKQLNVYEDLWLGRSTDKVRKQKNNKYIIEILASIRPVFFSSKEMQIFDEKNR